MSGTVGVSGKKVRACEGSLHLSTASHPPSLPHLRCSTFPTSSLHSQQYILAAHPNTDLPGENTKRGTRAYIHEVVLSEGANELKLREVLIKLIPQARQEVMAKKARTRQRNTTKSVLASMIAPD